MPFMDPGIRVKQGYSIYDRAVERQAVLRSAKNPPFAIGYVWPGYTVFPDWWNTEGVALWKTGLQELYDIVPYDGMCLDMLDIESFCDGECPPEGYSFELKNDNCKNDKANHDPKEFDDLPYIPGDVSIESGTMSASAYHCAHNKYEDMFYKQYNLHNLFCYHEGKRTYEFIEEELKMRPLLLPRSTFPGIGHYTSHWQGDNWATWSHMRLSISGLFSFQLFGVPHVGSDICGFTGDGNSELCARWYQVGLFYPYSRHHHIRTTLPHESWNYLHQGEDKLVIDAARSSVRQKYSLLRYFYTAFFEVHLKGGYVVSPAYFQFPGDTEAFTYLEESLMIGKGVLVSFALYPKQTEIDQYFPNANWYNLYTGKQVVAYTSDSSTGKHVKLEASYHQTPIHLLGGNIVAYQDSSSILRAEALLKEPIILLVALDPQFSAKGTIVFDDGVTPLTAQKRVYHHYELKYISDQSPTKITVSSLNSNSQLSFDSEKIEEIRIFGSDPQRTFRSASLELHSGEIKTVPVQYSQHDSISISTNGVSLASLKQVNLLENAHADLQNLIIETNSYGTQQFQGVPLMAENEDIKSFHKMELGMISWQICEVCFEKGSGTSGALDPGREFIQCRRCGMKVHRRCYGDASCEGGKEKSFTCTRCSRKSTKPVGCLICGRTEGCLKKIGKKKWIHPICGMFTDDFEITDFKQMHFEQSQNMSSQGTVPQCEYCETTIGQRLQCNYPGCMKCTHAHCAMRQKLNALKLNVNSEEGWQIKLQLGQNGEVSLPEFKEYIDEELNQAVVIHAPMESLSPGTKKPQRKPLPFSETQQKWHGMEVDISDPKAKNFILGSRGGKISIFCESHKPRQENCLCLHSKIRAKREEEKQSQMINCILCNRWYHPVCVGLPAGSLKEDYICANCEEWETLKRTYLLDEFSGTKKYSPTELLEDNFSNSLYPEKLKIKGTHNVVFVDILLICGAYNNRAKTILEFQSKLTLIYNHILIASEYPMIFRSMHSLLKKKITEAINYETKIKTEKLEIQEIIDSDFSLVDEKGKENNKTKFKIEQMIDVYQNKLRIYTKFFQSLLRKMEFLELLQRLQQNHSTFMEINEAKFCIARFEALQSEGNATLEIQFLKDQLEMYEGWENLHLKSVFQLAENQVESFLERTETETPEIQIQKIKEYESKKIPLSKISDLRSYIDVSFIRRQETIELLNREEGNAESWEEAYQAFKLRGASQNEYRDLMYKLLKNLCYTNSIPEALKNFAEYLRAEYSVQQFQNHGILLDLATGKTIKTHCTETDFSILISALDKLSIKPLDLIEKLKHRQIEVEEWRKIYQNIDDKEFTLKDLLAFLHQGLNYHLQLPEIESIKERISFVQKIQEYTLNSKQINYEYLSELLQQAKQYNIPEKALSDITNLKSDVQNLVIKSEQLLEQSINLNTNVKDVMKTLYTINECIKITQDKRLDLDVSDKLGKIITSFEWFLQVARIVKASESVDYDHLESLSKESLSKMLADAPECLGPASLLQQKIKFTIWSKCAEKKLDPMVKIIESDLEELVQEMHTLGITSSHPRYGELSTICQECYDNHKLLLSEYVELMNTEIRPFSDEEYNTYIERIHIFQKNAYLSQIAMTDFTKRMMEREKYVEACQELVWIINRGTKVSYKNYRKAYKKCIDTNVQNQSNDIIQNVKHNLERYEQWIKKYKQYVQKKSAGYSTIQINNEVNLEGMKEMVVEAEQLEIDLSEEISILKQDIAQCEISEDFAKEYLNKFKLNPKVENVEELKKLIKDIERLPLHSNTVYFSLKTHLWLENSSTLLQGKKKIAQWIEIFQERERILSVKCEDESFKELVKGDTISRLLSEYRNGVKLNQQINNIKKRQAYDEYFDLAILLQLLKSSNIDFSEEIEYLKLLDITLKKLENRLKELLSEKAQISEYEKLLEDLEGVPISVSGPRQEVVKILDEATQLKEKINEEQREAERKKTKVAKKWVENLLEDYDKLPVQIDEAEKLREKYTECSSLIQKMNETFLTEFDDKIVTLDEIMQIMNQMKELPFDMQLDEEVIGRAFTRKKYNAMIQNSDKIEEKPSFHVVQTLGEEFEALLKFGDPNDAVKLEEVKKVIAEAKQDIESIQKISSVEELEKISHTFSSKYIDYSPYIIEQKARLQLQPQLKAQLAGKRDQAEEEPKEVETSFFQDEEMKKMEERLLKTTMRRSALNSFINLIRINKELNSGDVAPESYAKEIEEKLMQMCKANDMKYKDMTEQIGNTLKKLCSYPLLSHYISVKGRSTLWKLCQIGDNRVVMTKMKNIEEMLAKKTEKPKEPAPPKDLRSTLFEDDKQDVVRQKSSRDPSEYPNQSMYQPHRSFEPNYEPQQEYGEASSESAHEEQQNMQFSSGEEEKSPGKIPYKIGQFIRATEEPYHPEPAKESAPISVKLKTSILVPRAYDPSTGVMEEDNENYIVDAPVGSLIQIWQGTLESGKTQIECKFHTCEQINGYYTLPMLTSKIEIHGRAKVSDVMKYLECNSTIAQVQLYSGWVVPVETGNAIENIERYVWDLERTEKCGVIDIKEMKSHIYLVPWTTRNRNNYLQNWKIKPIGEFEGVDPLTKFAFFIAFKKRDTLGVYRHLNPTLIRKVEIIDESKEGTRFSRAGAAYYKEEEMPEVGYPPEVSENDIGELLRSKLETLSKQELDDLMLKIDEEGRDKLLEVLGQGKAESASQPVPVIGYPPRYPAQPPGPVPEQYIVQSPQTRPGPSGRSYASEEASYYGSLQDNLDYQKKVQRVQEYLEINKPFFFQYISQIRGEPLSVISAPQVMMSSQPIAAPPLPQNYIPEGSAIPLPFPRVNPN